ncbi:MAG: 30S ribosomal protein S4 [Bradymonadales bacterium]|jgi:small subunit ribosomal protein S4
MSRYTGPRLKVLRRFGQQLPGLTRLSMTKRPTPPGQHGKQGHRRKLSDYGLRLAEKQKLRLNYGLSEKQFRLYIKRATSSKIDTGLRLLQLLESRLDNVVFRAGYAPTIPAARQLVNHGHITVNGRKVDIPSFQVTADDVVGLREKSKKIAVINESIATPTLIRPAYLNWDADKLTAKMTNSPDREDIPLEVQENLIIEFYSQMI